MLPEGCEPIIVTDAGFRGPWFKAVEAQGWDWVGRIRNKIKYYHTRAAGAGGTPTLSTKRRRLESNTSAKSACHLAMATGFACTSSERTSHLEVGRVVASAPSVPMHGPTAGCTRHPGCSRLRCPTNPGSSRKIKQLYAQRMQIEETFRDTKSHRWGFGLHYARCDDGRRLEVLLLIAALASLVLWLVGLCGRALDWARRLQANTERRRPVLSTVFIGRQLAASLASWSCRPARARRLRWRSCEPSSWRLCPHEFVGIPQRLAFSCKAPRERSDRGPCQLQRPS